MLPIFSAGTLFSGLILFMYIYHRSHQILYLSIVFMVLSSFIFVFSESMILVMGSLMGKKDIGIQFHRLEQVGGAFFLFAFPFFLTHFLHLRPSWNRVNLYIAYAGLVMAVSITIIAFTIPDLFISINNPQWNWKTQQGSFARGKQGVVYVFRDAMMALVILYSFSSTIADLIKSKDIRYILPVLLGIAIAIFGALDDSLHVHTYRHISFPGIPFSRFTTGVTIMNLFIMASMVRKFIDQSLLVEKTTKQLSENEKKLVNLIEANQSIVFLMNTDGTILDVNVAFRKTLGYSKDELMGKNIFEFLSHQNEDDKYQKIFFMEQLEKLDAKTPRVEFTIAFNQKYSMEPKEFMVHLQRIDYGDKIEILGNAVLIMENSLMKYVRTERMRLHISNYLWNAEQAANRLTLNLNKYLPADAILGIKTSLREMIINAMEHGNMHINFDQKTQAQMDGTYFQLIQKKQKEIHGEKQFVDIEYVLRENLVGYRITDHGDGFDAKHYLKNAVLTKLNEEGIAHGRGIMMTISVFDVVRYNDKGNSVTLLKKFPTENGAGNG